MAMASLRDGASGSQAANVMIGPGDTERTSHDFGSTSGGRLAEANPISRNTLPLGTVQVQWRPKQFGSGQQATHRSIFFSLA